MTREAPASRRRSISARTSSYVKSTRFARSGSRSPSKIIPGCTPAKLAAPPASTSPTSAPHPSEPAVAWRSCAASISAGARGPNDRPRGSSASKRTTSRPWPSTICAPSTTSSPTWASSPLTYSPTRRPSPPQAGKGRGMSSRSTKSIRTSSSASADVSDASERSRSFVDIRPVSKRASSRPSSPVSLEVASGKRIGRSNVEPATQRKNQAGSNAMVPAPHICLLASASVYRAGQCGAARRTAA
mmetsp:Transcript_39263/g.103526  ORF Transcript_39263/g.103526 Transcript_39263/m.103526 type:complete len:244 (+) Transcript_39263:45-776(+)